MDEKRLAELEALAALVKRGDGLGHVFTVGGGENVGDLMGELVAEVRRLRAEEVGKLACRLPGCGGWIGPDITGRPTCYSCGPPDMREYVIQRAERERIARAVTESELEVGFASAEMRADLAAAIRALPD